MSAAGRVYVVDDDASVRAALVCLLRSAGYAAEAFAGAQAFLQHPLPPEPACLVLDLSMPGLSGLDLQQRLAGAQASPPVVFLSGRAEIPDTVQAMKLGAVDFLTKPVDEAALLAAVGQALARHAEALTEIAETAAIRRRLGTLSARELETARLVIAGLPNKLIGARLGITEKTVKAHRGQAMRKMGVSSATELLVVLGKLGIAPEPPSP